MVGPSRTHFSYLLLAVAITGGCGYNQTSRCQMSFLPPAPKNAPPVELPEPPALEPNSFLKAEIPAILVPKLPPPNRRTQGDNLMQRAERRFQAGKRSYQNKDLT